MAINKATPSATIRELRKAKEARDLAPIDTENRFVSREKAENLTRLYGGTHIDKLGKEDEAALIAILGLFIYYEAIYPGSENLENAVIDAIHTDDDQTTLALVSALCWFEEVNREGAIGLLQYLLREKTEVKND